ncbi:MAG: porin family protein [Gammaproteobacteria bacterium]|nr:porin family protein [Gammaproteobacteria bacterium]
MLIYKLGKLLLMFTLALSLAVQAEETSNQDNFFWQHYLSAITGSSDADTAGESFSNDYSGIEYTYYYSQQYGVKFGSVNSSSAFDFSTFLTYEADSFYLAFTAKTNGDKVYGFGSIGFANTSESLEDPFACIFCVTNPPVRKSSSGIYWDIGVGWQVSRKWDMALGYSQIPADIADLTNSYLMVTYRF